MDALAAFRIAAIQARRDGMPICAKRHEEDAAALERAYDARKDREEVVITFT
jgi:hypothetical protein